MGVFWQTKIGHFLRIVSDGNGIPALRGKCSAVRCSPPSNNKLKITTAKTEEELLALFRFRYSIYVEEMDRTQHYADHENRLIRDPLDDFANTLIATDEKLGIVGTIRTNFLRNGDIGEYIDLYKLDKLSGIELETSSITTRLMILPSYRSKALAVKLSKAAYTLGLNNGIRSDYIDCNPPLDKFFGRLGHRYIHQCTHPEYGDVRVMRLDLCDKSYLESINSPFLDKDH